MRASEFAALLAAAWLVPQPGAAFAVGGDPAVVPEHFQVSTFASGLDFPFGVNLLQDGSLLVAVNPTESSYFAASGELHRFVDADDDGISDGPGTPLYTGLGSFTTSLRRAGDLVLVATGAPRIVVLRQGATPAEPLSFVGAIDVAFPDPWLHDALSLAVRARPGAPGQHELFFNIGSEANAVDSTASVTLSGLISGSAAPDSLHRVVLDDTGPSLLVSGLEPIASGLRNSFGAAFDPETGDLLLQDNGIDGSPDPNEPESADELNRIAAADLGGAVEHFGFSGHYVQYRTGTVVGSGGRLPVVAFQPIPPPDGAESEGAVDVVFAPPGFPAALQGGVLIGFHGRGALAGVANEENPVVFADPASGHTFHFVGNDAPDLGHPDTMAASGDRLFIADLTAVDGFATPGSGAVHRVRYAPPPDAVPLLPARAAVLLALAMLSLACFRSRDSTDSPNGEAATSAPRWRSPGAGRA